MPFVLPDDDPRAEYRFTHHAWEVFCLPERSLALAGLNAAGPTDVAAKFDVIGEQARAGIRQQELLRRALQ